MSDNKQLAQQFYDAVNAGEVDRLPDFCTEDFVDHEPFPGVSRDREGVAQFFGIMRSAFPDLRMEVHDMVAEGDRVAVRSTIHGTHEGEFMGMPATGKQVAVDAIDWVRVEDGKAAEHWGVTDVMGMMQQLGAVPEPTG